MSNRKIFIGSLATVVAAGTIGVSVTSAHFGGNGAKRNEVRSAIENNDFTAFQSAVKNSPKEDVIDTEVEFTAIVEAHQLREDGDYKAARAALENAGIELPVHKKFKERAGIKSAIETGDWEGFRGATEGKKMGKNIDTEEDFQKFIEAKQLHKDGEHEDAREIMEELGFYENKGHHKMR